MLNKQNAITVISLMQKATCRESRRLSFKRFSGKIVGSQHHALGSFEICVDFTNRETAFLATLLSLDRNDFGIGGDELYSVAVHHKQTKRQTDLRCSQPNTAVVVHRVKHIPNQRFQFAVKIRHRLAG